MGVDGYSDSGGSMYGLTWRDGDESDGRGLSRDGDDSGAEGGCRMTVMSRMGRRLSSD